jgi:hypothetical protein
MVALVTTRTRPEPWSFHVLDSAAARTLPSKFLPIEFSDHLPGVRLIELVINLGLLSVAVALPTEHFRLDHFRVPHSAVEALCGEHGDFDLRHVQLAGVFRGMVPDDSFEQRLSFLAEPLDPRLGVARVQVIQYQVNSTGLAMTFQEVPDSHCEVSLIAPMTNPDVAVSRVGFDGHENAARAAA